MLTDANISIDLPLKIVVRKNNGKTELVYQTMEEVASRYQVTELSNSIKKMDEGILALINQVIK